MLSLMFVCGVFSHLICICFRPVFEDSGPGRPLSCFMEEPMPYTDPTGAAGGGNCRALESPNQEQRLQAQRIRNQDSRGHAHTPQNRPHGHQSPDLPEGYGKCVRVSNGSAAWSNCYSFLFLMSVL